MGLLFSRPKQPVRKARGGRRGTLSPHFSFHVNLPSRNRSGVHECKLHLVGCYRARSSHPFPGVLHPPNQKICVVLCIRRLSASGGCPSALLLSVDAQSLSNPLLANRARYDCC